MKTLALVMFLAASGLAYYYYKPQLPQFGLPNAQAVAAPAPAPAAPPVSTREQAITELETKIENLRIDLIKELDAFAITKDVSGRPARDYNYVRNGRVIFTRRAIGNSNHYSYNEAMPELAEWITGPDFGLRRASELRSEIMRAKAQLDKVRSSK